jgi:hypothetical protein
MRCPISPLALSDTIVFAISHQSSSAIEHDPFTSHTLVLLDRTSQHPAMHL